MSRRQKVRRIERFKCVLLSTLIIASLIAPLLLISAKAVRGQDIEWTRQFGSSDYDIVYDIAVDASGNVYVAGWTDGALPGQASSGESDVFIRKYDGLGNEVWTRQFGTSDYDFGYVTVDASGNVYVVGNTYGTLPGQSSSGWADAFVRKYDGSGNELWTRQFGSSGSEYLAGDAAIDASGNVYVAGDTYGTLPGQLSSGDRDVFIRKYDGLGNEVWTRQFGSSSEDWANRMALDASGNVYFSGGTYGALPAQASSGSYDVFVRKYDESGNELWTRQFGSSAGDLGYVTLDASGNVYVAGFTEGALPGQLSSGDRDVFIRKYDGSGNEIWTRQFGSSSEDCPMRAVLDASGNVYVTGWTLGALPGQTYSGSYDAFVRKYDGSGNEIWTRQFGTSAQDEANHMALDASGNVYVIGSTYGALPGQTSAGDLDAFLVKFVQPAPAPVGGIAFPADKLALLAPWIALAALIAIFGVLVAVYGRRLSTRGG